MDRDDALEQLAARSFDLLVVGGGIIGAGIAEAATAHGLQVALVDRGDFANATSTASSKLIHGGLRYLRLGDVGLVREAHHERRALSNVVAPHLVHRLPFLFPFYDDGPYRPWFVQTGIVAYSMIAHSRLNWLVKPERAAALVPPLRRRGLRSCGLYADAWTNDGRLTIANVRGAADRGAVVVNYAEVVSVGRDGAEVLVDGRTIAVKAAAIVNATGPWVDRVRRLEDPAARPSIRLSKGVHVLVDGAEDWTAALTIAHDQVRVSFAVPWEGMLLLGTTDTEYDGEPEDVAVTDEDVRQVLTEAQVAVDGLGPARATYCGLRALPAGDGETANARRETVFTHGPQGMLSVAGGKLTTYRRIALDALEAVGVKNLNRRPAAPPRRDRPRSDSLAELGRQRHPRPPAAPVRLARRGGARTRRERPVAARAARRRPPGHSGAGRLCADARMGAHRRGRAAPADDRLARARALARAAVSF